MKVLNVPTVSTTEVKQSPTKIAAMADELNTGVYVLNRGKAISVTLTPNQYASLVDAQEKLLELETENMALSNIRDDDGTRIPADKISVNGIPDKIDPDDGWE